jgi:hypothetical protein
MASKYRKIELDSSVANNDDMPDHMNLLVGTELDVPDNKMACGGREALHKLLITSQEIKQTGRVRQFCGSCAVKDICTLGKAIN